MAIPLLGKKLVTGDLIDIEQDLGRAVIRIETSFTADKLTMPLIVINGCTDSPMMLDSGESFNYQDGIVGTLEVKQGSITVFF